MDSKPVEVSEDTLAHVVGGAGKSTIGSGLSGEQNPDHVAHLVVEAMSAQDSGQQAPSAEQEKMLSALFASRPDLQASIYDAIKQDPTGAGAKEALQGLTSTVTMLEGLNLGNNVMDFLARAMIEQASEQRQAALEGRIAAHEQNQQELLSQAAKMQEAAQAAMTGAMTNMVTSITSAMTSIGAHAATLPGEKGMSAAKSAALEEAAKTIADAKVPDDAVKTLKTPPPSNSELSLSSQMLQQIDLLGKSIYSAGSSATTSDAQMKAQAKEAEAELSFAASRMDDQNSIVEAYQESIKEILSKLAEIKQAEMESMQHITRA